MVELSGIEPLTCSLRMTDGKGHLVVTIAYQWVNLGPLPLMARPEGVWNTVSAPVASPLHAISIT